MTFTAFRRPLCLLLLIAAPFAGLWLGEGMVPLISISTTTALLILAFGATLLSPSPHRREKYYVLLTVTMMFIGAWAGGHTLVKRAITDCLEQGNRIQEALETYRDNHGIYPQQLEQLGIELPGQLPLHAPLLHYQPIEDNYQISLKVNHIQFKANRYTSFMADRQGN